MPLKAFIGAPVAFQIGDIAGIEQTICAIVCEARQLAADGGFVLTNSSALTRFHCLIDA